MNHSSYDFSDLSGRLVETEPSFFTQGSRYGLERECLRVNSDGELSMRPHPRELGSSLTHPAITTDFSESQIEFTTQPYDSLDGALRELEDLQNFVCTHLRGEYLWPLSMPCILPEHEEDIPLAYYGESDLGQKKTIYRRGLAHRYGRRMQTISGIHFNFSFGRPLLERLFTELPPEDRAKHELTRDPFSSFVSDLYFHVIRNFFRRAAAIPFLFGASPALDQSFFSGRPEAVPGRLQTLGKRSLYHPTATSLRLSGIGYINPNQRLLNISYNDLNSYATGMEEALSRHCEDYALFSVEDKEQLNANLLQIENEHYAPIRPKPDLQGHTSVLEALKDTGVHYLEIRSLDLNPFVPIAVDKERLAFVEMLLYDCLFTPSPHLSSRELGALEQDFQLAVWKGREENLRLSCGLRVEQIGSALCDRLEVFSEVLDSEYQTSSYSEAIRLARASFRDSALTPSARVLAQVREFGDMVNLGRYLSQEHCRYFGQHRLPLERRQELLEAVQESFVRQEEIERQELQLAK